MPNTDQSSFGAQSRAMDYLPGRSVNVHVVTQVTTHSDSEAGEHNARST